MLRGIQGSVVIVTSDKITGGYSIKTVNKLPVKLDPQKNSRNKNNELKRVDHKCRKFF